MAGRPVSYDRDAVVDGAMVEFWARGFMTSDVEQLTQAAGLNRHSLYKRFGGKRGLFLEALRRYVDEVAAAYVAMLESGTRLDDLLAYFERISGAQGQADDPAPQGFDHRGCFLVNTAIELGRTDPDVAALLDAYYARIEEGFAGLIRRGQEAGTIRGDLDPQITARWLRVTGQGLSVSSRIGAMPQDLAQMMRLTLAPMTTQ
ncbi:TetR/AcrR family transcriptional regulator [Caenibius sp. WL]|uniref:TetR/AcrR family transcriptional regulator n=1 Tax=Caenibius sp. WL TaxID=2872646 RepID=UPI001C99FABC|nr:TetR/AcrR family transcriptional regulator [Caenibius sp. WL]QZP09403.1 TetR/AcrR family transcriptional regulator [Caenibius sp. WL]